jgi:hypothetical protein
MSTHPSSKVDEWIVQKATRYILQRFSADFDLKFEKDDPDLLGFLDGMVTFLGMMADDGVLNASNCKYVPPLMRSPRLKPVLDEWAKGAASLVLDELPTQLRKHFPAIPEAFDPEKKAFCVQLQLMDAHAELISQVMGPRFEVDFSKPDSGSFCYFIPPRLQAKTNYVDWVESLWSCVFEKKLHVGSFRQLDLQRKASTTSEWESVLEAILERQWADVKHSKQGKEAALLEFKAVAHRFTFFSNLTSLKAGQEIGVNYDGTSEAGSCYGGKCLVLMGVNEDEIICLATFWDGWMEC